MFDLEVQYGNVRAVLHEITVEVVSIGEVLLTELSEPCISFIIILDDTHLAETDDALDMVPPVVLLLDRFIYDREASFRR